MNHSVQKKIGYGTENFGKRFRIRSDSDKIHVTKYNILYSYFLPLIVVCYSSASYQGSVFFSLPLIIQCLEKNWYCCLINLDMQGVDRVLSWTAGSRIFSNKTDIFVFPIEQQNFNNIFWRIHQTYILSGWISFNR